MGETVENITTKDGARQIVVDEEVYRLKDGIWFRKDGDLWELVEGMDDELNEYLNKL